MQVIVVVHWVTTGRTIKCIPLLALCIALSATVKTIAQEGSFFGSDPVGFLEVLYLKCVVSPSIGTYLQFGESPNQQLERRFLKPIAGIFVSLLLLRGALCCQIA